MKGTFAMPPSPQERDHAEAEREKRDREKSKAIRELLERVASGETTVDDALCAMKNPSFVKKLLVAFSRFIDFKIMVYPLRQWREDIALIQGSGRSDFLRPPWIECGREFATELSCLEYRKDLGNNTGVFLDDENDSLYIGVGAESTIKIGGIFSTTEYEVYLRSQAVFMRECPSRVYGPQQS
jgi:hypothetical protein